MAMNFPGPYELRIFYVVLVGAIGVDHQMRFNITLDDPLPDPGDLFSTILAVKRDASNISLSDATDDWIALLQPLYKDNDANFDHAELWVYEPDSFDASFVSAYAIGLDGTASVGATTTPAGQAIYSFRTQEGGVLKINLMESVKAPGLYQGYSDLGGSEQALVNAVQNGDVPWLARDTSYPFVFTKAFPGQSEATFKKRYR